MTRPLLPVRCALGAAVATLGFVSLSGCGGEDSEPSGGSDTASESPGDPTEELLALYEDFAKEATTANVTMTTEGSQTTSTAEGVLDLTSEPVSMALTMNNEGQEMKTIFIDGTYYLEAPTGGEQWVAMDLDQLSELTGVDMSQQLDPEYQLGQLEKGIVSTEYVGEEDVRGETMEHYSATIDPEAMLEGFDPKARERAAEVLPDTTTQDLWFDEDGRIHRSVVKMGELGTTTLVYTDWGVDANITAPPSDQVTPMPGG